MIEKFNYGVYMFREKFYVIFILFIIFSCLFNPLYAVTGDERGNRRKDDRETSC